MQADGELMTVALDPPAKFAALLRREQQRWERLHEVDAAHTPAPYTGVAEAT